MARTRPRGFAPWHPRADTLALLDQVKAVLADETAVRARLTAELVPTVRRMGVAA